uniref:Uncharacterized protein n=1 Tax=Arundo donax TaxID=35708 RepID=A0A0A9DRH2_ARUDO
MDWSLAFPLPPPTPPAKENVFSSSQGEIFCTVKAMAE